MTITREHLAHLIQLQNEFSRKAEIKYLKGVEEHGGNLWDKSVVYLLDEAIAENIDQFIYLMTLREKLVERGSI